MQQKLTARTIATTIQMEAAQHQQHRRARWDAIGRQLDKWSKWGGYYHRRLTRAYQLQVAPGQRVLELGCGDGDLLAALDPKLGVGLDFSGPMVRHAAQRHPGLHFVQADAHATGLSQKFDIIILSDLVNDLWDVQSVFDEIGQLSTPRTRIILNSYSRLWELPLAVAGKLRLAKPTLGQNWLTVEDMVGLLRLADFEVIRTWQEVLWPLRTPLIATLLNRFVVKVWPFGYFAMTNLIVARPVPRQSDEGDASTVSVIIPARNEAGNIPQIFSRVPNMGRETELIFVEGHSTDDTYATIEQTIAQHATRSSQLLRQAGEGKADAVKLGFAHARGDIVMILDADLTVPPEDLPRFYDVLRSGKGEFVNGVRLVYPMQQEAMHFINLMGNKFFSMAFSWLLGQPIKDTLCGTKVLRKTDYELIAANRDYFGDFDPFGDFDLLFGAAKQNMKIVDIPIRYHERTYGSTNIHRWRHGWLLFRMVLKAAARIKFV